MTLFIPDFSSWDAGVNMSGALAVIVKATQGTGYVNPFYGAMKAEAARRGAFFCAYHFLEEGDGAAQAAHAHSVIGNDVPAFIDFEPMDPPQGQSYPTLADCCGFTDAYRSHGGSTHGVYLPEWYWARGTHGLRGASLKPLMDRGLLLWSSNYGRYTDASDGTGWMPYGGMKVTFWQYSSTTPFGGMPGVDFTAFRGSKYAGKQDKASVAAVLTEFRALVTTGRYPAGPVPPAPPLPDGDIMVPKVRGMTAGRAHDVVTAAHLVPVNPGIPGDAIVTGTSPSGAVKLGGKVTIHAAMPPVIDSPATGDWVALLQEDLNKRGKAGPHLAVDGKCGQLTVDAVGRFQVARGLALDGIAGKLTWIALGEL